mmetsp:Transcript_557/g.842  ORF Transcript_557/g.842 Transcript_557/m.842 type:complete len:111 (-) Transcript_557:139-471(-)
MVDLEHLPLLSIKGKVKIILIGRYHCRRQRSSRSKTSEVVSFLQVECSNTHLKMDAFNDFCLYPNVALFRLLVFWYITRPLFWQLSYYGINITLAPTSTSSSIIMGRSFR